jgi:prepilin-type N-terminal cleavage/methylation domain-containing protein
MKNSKGYTLVELLIVVFVLGILFTMALSRFAVIPDEFRKRADVASASRYARDVELKLQTGVLELNGSNTLTVTANDLGVESLGAQYNEYDLVIEVDKESSTEYDWKITIRYTDGSSRFELDTNGEDTEKGFEKFVYSIR